MQSERKIHADINQARDGWIQITLSGEGAAELTEAQIEAALSAAEPVGYLVHDKDNPDGRYFKQKPSISDDDMSEYEIWIEPLYAAPPAPSMAVKALADAYKAGFDASSQGYNGEVFPEYEADNEWLAQRDSDLSSLSAQVQDVAGWQPIETAPKDGTRVIGADQLYVIGDIYWQPDGNETETGEPGWINGMRDRYEKDYVFNATHWMSLPPVPAAPAKREGGHD